MTAVPITDAVSDGKAPVAMSVEANPVLNLVIVKFGDLTGGMQPQDALIYANHLVAAVQMLQSVAQGKVQ